MASGMEMMLKSFGIDPDKIKKDIAGFGQIIVELKQAIDRIESNQALILTQNREISERLGRLENDQRTDGSGGQRGSLFGA